MKLQPTYERLVVICRLTVNDLDVKDFDIEDIPAAFDYTEEAIQYAMSKHHDLFEENMSSEYPTEFAIIVVDITNAERPQMLWSVGHADVVIVFNEKGAQELENYYEAIQDMKKL